MKKQIKLLEKYGITNYIIENNKLIINGSLDLRSLTSVDKDFLKETTINGSLDLQSLTSVDKDFLKETTINGYLYLHSLTSVDKDFLKETTINGSLDLRSLTSVDKNMVQANVKQLESGYNEKRSYCYFDDILSKVLSVKETKGYTIYTTPFGFIAQKRDKTAHGNTIKKAIIDLEFKFIAEKLKKEPINKDTVITDAYYRIITGSCEQGVIEWKRKNRVDVEEILAKELLPILEKTNAYGLNKFKELISF